MNLAQRIVDDMNRRVRGGTHWTTERNVVREHGARIDERATLNAQAKYPGALILDDGWMIVGGPVLTQVGGAQDHFQAVSPLVWQE